MDADRFDSLARSRTTSGSRRRALTTALAGSLGLLGLAHPNKAMGGGACKPACTECQTCKKGKCHKTNHGKVCKKGKCEAKAEGTGCSVGSCQSGNCLAATTSAPPFCASQPDNTDCNGGRCRAGVCHPRPTCPGFKTPCASNAQCCSDNCGDTVTPGSGCLCSQPGEPCYTTTDCCLTLRCIGYSCIV